MGGLSDMTVIRSIEELRSLYDLPKAVPANKVINHLDDYCARFIALSPFIVLASVGRDGLIDISPRGDAPGFVTLEDDKSLLIPDRRGNNRIDTLINLVETANLSAFFMVPGVDETLRVQGLAEIDRSPDLCARFEVNGKLPQTIIRLKAREVYFQCAKALMRSKLWAGTYAIQRDDFPTMGEIMKAHAKQSAPAETKEEMLKRYKDIIY